MLGGIDKKKRDQRFPKKYIDIDYRSTKRKLKIEIVEETIERFYTFESGNNNNYVNSRISMYSKSV